MKHEKAKLPRQGKENRLGKGLGIGTAAAAGVTVAAAALVASVIDRGAISYGAMGKMAILILILASGCGSYIAQRLAGSRRLAVCLLTGGCYLVLLLILTAFAFGGTYRGLPLTLGIVMGSCTAVGLLSASRSGKRQIKRRRMR